MNDTGGQATIDRLTALSDSVRKLCKASMPSPVDTARTHLELENDLLALKLTRNQLIRQRAREYYAAFRGRRWEGDIVQNYNEAAAGANADVSQLDQRIADLKTYVTYLENLASILRSFTASCFRD